MNAQLLIYRFGSEAAFEGQLVGALERIEAGRAVRVLDVLFVARDEAGELAAIGLHHGAQGIVGPALSFRLDPEARRRATERALEHEAAQELADTLEPGAAVAAVLVEQTWTRALEDAVARLGGTSVTAELVEADRLTPGLGRALPPL